jgi:hypothetical protein
VRVHSLLFFGQYYIYSRIPTCFKVLVIIYNRVIFFFLI